MENNTAKDALSQFAAIVRGIASEMEADWNASEYHMENKAALASKYNVRQHLFPGHNFFIECARKEACRRAKG